MGHRLNIAVVSTVVLGILFARFSTVSSSIMQSECQQFRWSLIWVLVDGQAGACMGRCMFWCMGGAWVSGGAWLGDVLWGVGNAYVYCCQSTVFRLYLYLTNMVYIQLTKLLKPIRRTTQIRTHFRATQQGRVKCRCHVPSQRSQHRKQFRKRADTKKNKKKFSLKYGYCLVLRPGQRRLKANKCTTNKDQIVIYFVKKKIFFVTSLCDISWYKGNNKHHIKYHCNWLESL